MRAVVQRVRDASVTVDGAITGRIDLGLLAYIGIERSDTVSDAAYLATKIAGLRIFPDEAGRMNLPLAAVEATTADGSRVGILAISQFTLLADVRKGRRPSYNAAAPPEAAHTLYLDVVERLRAAGLTVETGVFQAHMDVRSVNDGPVTLLVDSNKRF
ncbi:MAG: D-aminoacyl-tRNA deacylase [Spirochaetota bacterium]